MPDTKFSFAALKEHLRRYLWVYVVGLAICLFGTSLLWTTTQPRPSNEETVTIFLADTYSNPEPLSSVARSVQERLAPVEAQIKLVEFQNLQYTEDDYTSSMVLMTRLAVGEGDAFFASQAAMDALVRSEALLPLDDAVAEGWLGEYGLEPCYGTVTDEETGESTTFLAGLKLDSVTALKQMGAFMNEGAYLCVANNGGNVDATMKALEFVLADLTEAKNAQAEDTEPAA